jgi:hypothetical protein
LNQSGIAGGCALEKAEGRTCVRPSPVTRLNTPSLRRSEGRCDQLGSLSEPHRKQNLYANPKRTAKSKTTTTLIQTRQRKKGSNYFQKFFPAEHAINLEGILDATI